ncbi:kinesin motor protein cin8 [Quaeritorhiza haematococci]|nr:kinesin motor protein cin8 [Quaeritorhiza haematococci]
MYGAKDVDLKETNIQVVVRLRPRNNKEIKENSPVCITANALKGREVHLRAGSADPTKTYTFDKVFGPDAEQELVFNDVVAPMLEETGTGKTYTMEGDLGNIRGQKAGIIPRTLYQLFDKLENDRAEYSVRVSFIELYNEELRDLLSSEDDFRKLRIFEDLSRKGSVLIQGLEEILVKNATDVIAILQQGSNKRQIATTKMNEHSRFVDEKHSMDFASRSHCIFSITVHIKEATPDGEDLLKVGKLNLVDLAGSENIGRSGAENKRAKEAGMINQVCIPSPTFTEEESRTDFDLFPGSGGRTKTCIIAAVSPAKCNIEESISTLDYAHRAKNIRNKPEVNQRMTKKALIREYINEIERLKADLLAAREKNGIYLSSETYNTLVDENQSHKDQLEEISKSISAKEELIQHHAKKYQEQMDLLHHKTSQLDATSAELEQKKSELDEVMDEMRRTKQQLTEQTVLTRAHAETEKRLNALASGLVATLKSSVQDLYGLHEKLDRKSAIELENLRLFQSFQQTLLSQMSDINSQVSDIKHASETLMDGLTGKMTEFLGLQEEAVSAEKATLETDLTQVKSTTSELYQQSEQQLHALADSNEGHLTQLDRIASSMSRSMTERQNKMRDAANVMVQNVVSTLAEYRQEMSSWTDSLRGTFCEMVEAMKSHVVAQEQHHHRMYDVIMSNADKETVTEATNVMSDIALDQWNFVDARLEPKAKELDDHLSIGRQRFSQQADKLSESYRSLEKTVVDESNAAAAVLEDGKDQIHRTTQEAMSSCSEYHSNLKRKTSDLTESVSGTFKRIHVERAAMVDDGRNHIGGWKHTLRDFGDTVDSRHANISQHITQSRNEIACNQLAEDQPTGKTPRKRGFNHDEILRDFRERNGTLMENEDTDIMGDFGDVVLDSSSIDSFEGSTDDSIFPDPTPQGSESTSASSLGFQPWGTMTPSKNSVGGGTGSEQVVAGSALGINVAGGNTGGAGGQLGTSKLPRRPISLAANAKFARKAVDSPLRNVSGNGTKTSLPGLSGVAAPAAEALGVRPKRTGSSSSSNI